MGIIIAVDQAKVTGVAVFNDQRLIKYCLIESTCKSYDDVIFEICDKVQQLITFYKPDKVLFEDVAKQSNSNVHKKLSMLLGALIHLCHQNLVQYDIIHSATWRSVLPKSNSKGKKLKREELKKLSMELVKERYDVDVVDDIADAICMGLYYIERGA